MLLHHLEPSLVDSLKAFEEQKKCKHSFFSITITIKEAWAGNGEARQAEGYEIV